jgi:hypothetical protein
MWLYQLAHTLHGNTFYIQDCSDVATRSNKVQLNTTIVNELQIWFWVQAHPGSVSL